MNNKSIFIFIILITLSALTTICIITNFSMKTIVITYLVITFVPLLLLLILYIIIKIKGYK